ncbi:MAG: hypothetical protein ACM3P0_14030, partial [Acidobacteriota bacterium]
MKKIVLLLSALAVIVSLDSCSKQKPKAKGPDDRIYVIADSVEFQAFKPIADSVFGKIIYTPQPEKTFDLIRRDFSGLDSLKDSPNILIIAPLNSGSAVSEYIGKLLSDSTKLGVNTGREF